MRNLTSERRAKTAQRKRSPAILSVPNKALFRLFGQFYHQKLTDYCSSVYSGIKEHNYCSNVWHFRGARNSEKLELLNKQALRLILEDFSSTYTDLLKKMNTVSLSDKRIQTMLVMVYKCLSGLAPAYIRSFFHERDSVYNLRGARKLYVPRSRTTTFGLHSCKHLATTAWNKLPDHVRTAETVTAFRSKIKNFIM